MGRGVGSGWGGVAPLTPGEGLGWEAEVLLGVCSFPSLLEGECGQRRVVFCGCPVCGG